MADDIKVIRNERGIGTGQTRDGTTPETRADGSLSSTSNARNPIVSEPAPEASRPRDAAGKTPGSAESGAMDPAQKSGPGKTPGKSEG